MSELDHTIPPEIINDALYNSIKEIASDTTLENMLEIGSSSGNGSTKAFLEGMKKNVWSELYCLEVSQVRFAELVENTKKNDRVKCFNMSSVQLKDFPTEEQITKFYRDIYSVLNMYKLETVLGWLNQDINYIKEHQDELGFGEDGIDYIKKEFGIKNFDLVLIDGSEFTGYVEFKKVYGSKIIILDDVKSYKNFFSYRDLATDSSYKLVEENKDLRNGYAIFEKRD